MKFVPGPAALPHSKRAPIEPPLPPPDGTKSSSILGTALVPEISADWQLACCLPVQLRSFLPNFEVQSLTSK